MDNSSVQLFDLPDELLMTIFNKLNNVDVIQSLVGINMRLNKIAYDLVFTNCLTLFIRSSNDVIIPVTDAIFNCVCSQILPEIHYKIKWLNLESLYMKRVLETIDYPNLYKLGLYNIEQETFKRLFTNENALTGIHMNQISELIITISDNKNQRLMEDILRNVYTHIFTVFTKLHYLNFDPSTIFSTHYLSFMKKPPTFFSSILTELHVNLKEFVDCLYLLDGGFNQLRVFYVNINTIFRSSAIINNKEKLPNLQTFSLKCDCETFLYDELILPLLHRMLHVEELALYLVVSMPTFLDGNHLKKNIINHLSRLNKFIFNIRSVIYLHHQHYLPSNEEIQHTFINLLNNKVISCVDYFRGDGFGRCHIYSYPYSLTHYQNITNSFPGGLFKCVRQVALSDDRPFEHDFFLQIAQSFPYLKTLSVNNWKRQKHKHCRTKNSNDKHLSIVEFPHLISLDLFCVHIDYVVQFLDHTKTSIPNSLCLFVGYRSLRKATHNFTRDTLRINCSKLNELRIIDKTKISEHIKAYFPNRKVQ